MLLSWVPFIGDVLVILAGAANGCGSGCSRPGRRQGSARATPPSRSRFSSCRILDSGFRVVRSWMDPFQDSQFAQGGLWAYDFVECPWGRQQLSRRFLL